MSTACVGFRHLALAVTRKKCHCEADVISRGNLALSQRLLRHYVPRNDRSWCSKQVQHSFYYPNHLTIQPAKLHLGGSEFYQEDVTISHRVIFSFNLCYTCMLRFTETTSSYEISKCQNFCLYEALLHV